MMGGVTRQGPPILSQTEGSALLTKYIKEGTVFCAGKLGTSELDVIWWYLHNRTEEPKLPYPTLTRRHICANAGIFPPTDESIDLWANAMIVTVLPGLDICVEWNPSMPLQESNVLNEYSPKSARIPLRSLEPYYMTDPDHIWTLALPASADVVVISPFSESIKTQWEKRLEIWKDKHIWNSEAPKLQTIQSGYNPLFTKNSGWPTAVREGGWAMAVRYIVDKVVYGGAKYAIVGAGALSLPIVYELKIRGITAIHLGGATQILFGIKGNRWLSHSVISKFFNDAWVNPSKSEVPDHAHVIEGACYW
jgi:hypothetical protein